MRSSTHRKQRLPGQRLLDVNEQSLALALSPDERERVKERLGPRTQRRRVVRIRCAMERALFV